MRHATDHNSVCVYYRQAARSLTEWLLLLMSDWEGTHRENIILLLAPCMHQSTAGKTEEGMSAWSKKNLCTNQTN